MPANRFSGTTAEGQFGYLLHDVARLMRREFDKRLKTLGLTRAQWVALAALIQQDGQTQTELAFVLDMGRAPLGTLIDRLERDGWVRRKPDPNDRRANRLYITDKINSLLDDFARASRDVYRDTTNGLSGTDLKQLQSMLDRMKENLLALSGNGESSS